MTREQVMDRVLQLLRRIAPEAEPQQIDPGQDLREQVDMDSMDVLNLMIAIEKELGIAVPERDYARMNTLDELVEYVAERL